VQQKGFRLVYHYGAAVSLTSYINDIGRACYDGKVSLARFIFNSRTHKVLLKTKADDNDLSSILELHGVKKLVTTSTCKRLFLSEKLGGSEISCMLQTSARYPCCSCVEFEKQPLESIKGCIDVHITRPPEGYVIYNNVSDIFMHLRMLQAPLMVHGNIKSVLLFLL
jgi:superfamily II DNA helicase RecQ